MALAEKMRISHVKSIFLTLPLIVSLINIVNKIPIDNPQFENEGCLVNYIYKSI